MVSGMNTLGEYVTRRPYASSRTPRASAIRSVSGICRRSTSESIGANLDTSGTPRTEAGQEVLNSGRENGASDDDLCPGVPVRSGLVDQPDDPGGLHLSGRNVV